MVICHLQYSGLCPLVIHASDLTYSSVCTTGTFLLLHLYTLGRYITTYIYVLCTVHRTFKGEITAGKITVGGTTDGLLILIAGQKIVKALKR